MKDYGYTEMLADIKRRFGFELDFHHTGGGIMVLETQLEGGAWLWISDWDAGLNLREDRLKMEADGITVGWNVTIYADDGSYPGDTTLACVRHETALTDELPGLIEMALKALPENAHHDYRKGGQHTVTCGQR